MKKRVFFAIPLTGDIAGQLESYIKNINVSNARWIPVQNWHVTLLFMGSIQQALIPEIINEVQSVLNKMKTFQLKFKQIVFAPPQNPTQMIWAELESNKNYELLYLVIHKRVKHFIFEKSKSSNLKGNIPHITLARLFKSRDFVPRELPQPKIDNLIVNTVQLLESKLSQNGSLYTEICRFELS